MASTLQLHKTVPFAVLLLCQFWSHGRRKKEIVHQFSSNNKKWISLSPPFLFPFKEICTGSSEENFFLASVFAQLLWTPPYTVSFLLSYSRVAHPLLVSLSFSVMEFHCSVLLTMPVCSAEVFPVPSALLLSVPFCPVLWCEHLPACTALPLSALNFDCYCFVCIRR